MKKGQVYEGIVTKIQFPNKGIICLLNEEDKSDREITIKNVIPGQVLKFQVTKIRKGKAEGRVLEVINNHPNFCESPCKHFGQCGGCLYQDRKSVV